MTTTETPPTGETRVLTAEELDCCARAYWDAYRRQDGFSAPYDRLGDAYTGWIKRGLTAALTAYLADHRAVTDRSPQLEEAVAALRAEVGVQAVLVEMTPQEVQVAMSALMVMGTVAANPGVRETCIVLYSKLAMLRITDNEEEIAP